MKTIKMLRDFPVARDGFTVEIWKAGRVIEDAPDDIAADLAHPRTIAAVILTGNAKTDDAAFAAGVAAVTELSRKAHAAAEAFEAAEYARAAYRPGASAA